MPIAFYPPNTDKDNTMAKRTILVDDITGEESDTVQSYSFKLPRLDEDGDITYVRVSFDAEPDTVRGFIEAMNKGIQTKYLNKPAVQVKDVTSTESGTDSEASDMRDFAKSKGLTVKDRGRVPADIQEAYRAAVAAGDWPPYGQKSATEHDDDGDTDN